MSRYLFVLCAVLFFSQSLKASPGDTTWVQANINQLTAPANFDTAVVFPNAGVTYRKILMIFTLGKYVCPGSPQYCGSWDYIVNNYIMTPGGDTMEISRLITPYATTSTYFPNTWTYNYVFDVTDYAALLKSNATVRIGYGGYSYGFTANVRFAFIEGTPDRNVIGLQRLWHGQFQYGVSTDPITNHVYPLTATVPAGTVSADMKMRITGHGEDANDCNEFCPNTYNVLLNNAVVTTQNFFRTNCGDNPVYTQTGTWIYNRAGWCPGALVNNIYNPLPGAVGTYSVNVTFPAYTTVASSSGNSTPTYDIEAASVYYGAINKTLDVSLEEILAPNDDPNYSRSNTVCGQPVIHVHNSGSTVITSLSINYGLTDSAASNYIWNGSLAALQDTDITLPGIAPLQNDAGLAPVQQFTAQIVQVNGQTDDDTTNNTLTSSFRPAPLLQTAAVIIKMKTSTINQYAESWQILDMNNNVVGSRSNTSQRTLYIDTVNLGYSCYKLIVSTPDGGGFDYGTYFTGSSSDNGYLNFYREGFPAPVTLPNYHSGDFGNGFTQYFETSQFPAGVTNEIAGYESIEAYPNPARNMVNIDLSGMQQMNGKIQFLDALGRIVSETVCNDAHKQVSVEGLANGVYTILFINDKQPANRLTTRLLIAK